MIEKLQGKFITDEEEKKWFALDIRPGSDSYRSTPGWKEDGLVRERCDPESF